MSSTRDHAYTSEEKEMNPAAETSYAERSRTLLHHSSEGTLSTHSAKRSGFPFGSLMPFALEETGCPLFLISRMAMHTQNLEADPRASLFVAEDSGGGDSLGAARVTLVGNATPVPPDTLETARETYLNQHQNAGYWVDFKDFVFYRLALVDVYYVGGFGVMGWVEVADFAGARPDPLADAAQGILQHMNADHADTLVLLARVQKGIESEKATMTAVDRLGFHVRLKTAKHMRSVRIGFPGEIRTGEECRAALITMVKEARSQG